MKLRPMQPVTGVTLVLVPLLYMAAYAVLFTTGFDIQIKSVVIGAIFGALLSSITGHWLNDVAKRPPPPTPPQVGEERHE